MGEDVYDDVGHFIPEKSEYYETDFDHKEEEWKPKLHGQEQS